MAMPASGIIRLSGCSQACGSISVAACGNATMPKSLSALSVAAGKSTPHGMLEFYSYDNTLIITPADPITGITAAGTTCNLTVCGPAFNTYTFSDACTWITPNAPQVPSPTGSVVGIGISANTGAARAGLLCILPTVGGQQNRCFCQLAGVASKGVKYITISCTVAASASNWRSCISGCTMSAGECYIPTISWCLLSLAGGKGTMTVRLYCNTIQQCVCSIANTSANCAGTWCPLVKYGESWLVCTSSSAIANFGGDYCSMMCMNAITNSVGSFCLSTPNCIFSCSYDPLA